VVRQRHRAVDVAGGGPRDETCIIFSSCLPQEGTVSPQRKTTGGVAGVSGIPLGVVVIIVFFVVEEKGTRGWQRLAMMR
jgi:hypothetical protein